MFNFLFGKIFHEAQGRTLWVIFWFGCRFCLLLAIQKFLLTRCYWSSIGLSWTCFLRSSDVLWIVNRLVRLIGVLWSVGDTWSWTNLLWSQAARDYESSRDCSGAANDRGSNYRAAVMWQDIGQSAIFLSAFHRDLQISVFVILQRASTRH